MLAGLTGCGKTEALRKLAAEGEQVLDLEALANHRGSAFGGIGLGAQPSHREFARRVHANLAEVDPARPLWIEDEGPFIGAVGVPGALQRAIARADVVICRAPLAERVERLLALYGATAPSELIGALERTRPRLGDERAAAAIGHVERGEVGAAIRVVLPYFDAAYAHRTAGLRRRMAATFTA